MKSYPWTHYDVMILYMQFNNIVYNIKLNIKYFSKIRQQ